jgi:hypothetical protein
LNKNEKSILVLTQIKTGAAIASMDAVAALAMDFPHECLQTGLDAMTSYAAMPWTNRLPWAVFALAIMVASPAISDPGDKAGWSVDTDPRRRAFLLWVPQKDGPRVLMLGCLRDAGTFTTMSYSVGEHDKIERVNLTLSNGQATFSVDGQTGPYPAMDRSSFISDLDVNDNKMRTIGRQLMPVLEGTDDITMTISPGTPSGSTKTVRIPIAGLAPVLNRFRTVCFR